MKRLLLSLCLLCLPPSALPAADPLPQATLPAGCPCGCAAGGPCDCTDCPATGKADVKAASVKVQHFARGVIGGGSGTVVGAEDGAALVLTNRHVCPDPGEKIVVTSADGKRSWTALWLGVDDRADLCALAIDAKDSPTPAPPADAEVPAGGPVVQVGYPHGRGPSRREGRSRGVVATVQGGTPVFEATVATEQGDSGSGVFDADGRLVAVVWGGVPGSGCASCVHLNDVHRFVGSHCHSWFPRLARRLEARRESRDSGPVAAPKAKTPAGCPSCPGGQCPAPPAKARPPQSTLPPAVDEDAGDAAGCQVKVPVRCRGVNRTGQQCAWVSTATLARFLGVPAAAGLDSDHTWALNDDPDQVSRELTRLGVRHRYQRPGRRDAAVLEWSCREGLGAAVGIGHGAHVVALVTFDRERNLVQTLSNNKATRHVETWAGGVEEFLGSWNGWAVILEPEATGTPIACQAPPSRAAPCPAGNCGVPAARPMVRPGQDGTGRR